MAFNPFHGFRKHKKTIFAGLTVLCMITFVITFGAGDIFSYLPGARGARSDEEKAGMLFGEAVPESVVIDIQRKRNLANQYMMVAIEVAHNNIIRIVDAELLSKLKPDDPAHGEIKSVVQLWMGAFFPDPQFARFRSTFIQYYQQNLRQNIDRLERVRTKFAAAKKEVEAARVLLLQEMLLQDESFLARNRGQLYFGGGSTKNLRDLLDFKIWMKQADRLGVQLTNEDVGKLVNQESLKQLDQQSFKQIDSFFRSQFRNTPSEVIVQALKDEFRVRLAKASLLGYEARPDNTVPPPVTPFEYWQFFRDQRTESIVTLLPIPVRHADFLAKVAKPTDDELKSLFEKYKNTEPAPDAEFPGFKQPGRIEIEWVSARADTPYYMQQAAKQLRLTQDLAQLGAITGVLTGGPISAAVSTALTSAFDLPLVAKYEDLKHRFPAPSWTDSWTLNLHDSSRDRAENVAALVGQAAANLGTQHPLAAVPAAFDVFGFYREARHRSRLWTTFFLTGAGSTPYTAAGMAYAVTPSWQYLPLADVKGYMREKLLESTARDLVAHNLTKMRDDLERLSMLRADTLLRQQYVRKPIAVAEAVSTFGTGDTLATLMNSSVVTARDIKDGQRASGEAFLAAFARTPWTAAAFVYQQQSLPEQKAHAYVADAIKEYHLKRGGTQQPRDRFTIVEDPGLQPIKDSYLRNRLLDNKAKNFAQLFFPTSGAYAPQRWPRMDFSSMPNTNYQQMDAADAHMWSKDDEPFLYWKTGDLPAYVPTFDEVKNKVEDAWRFDKARTLAKEEAEKIAAEARKVKGDADRVLKDGTPHSGRMFTLDRVARLSKPIRAFESRQMGNAYQPYKLPETQVEYPSGDFLEQLLNLKDRGDVIVLADRPRANYYVAALVFRAPPDEKAFYDDFSKHTSSLLARIEQERHFRDKFRDAVTMQLEKEANIQISKSFREKFESQRNSDE